MDSAASEGIMKAFARAEDFEKYSLVLEISARLAADMIPPIMSAFELRCSER